METFLGNNKVQLFKKLTRPFMNHKKLETKSVVWKNGNRNVILTVWQDKIKTILTCYLFICLFIFNQVPLSSTRFFNLNVCRIIFNLSAIFIPGCPKMVVQEIRGKRSPLPSWIKLKKTKCGVDWYECGSLVGYLCFYFEISGDLYDLIGSRLCDLLTNYTFSQPVRRLKQKHSNQSNFKACLK